MAFGPGHESKVTARITAMLMLCGTSLAIANPFGGVPNPPVSGAALSASEMNQNFAAIASYMNTLDQRLEVIEGRPLTGSAPVGTVVASLLTPLQFAEEVPDDERWVIADGSSNYTNTRWFQITGSAVIPDLRGRFLRGGNLGRAPSEGNPDNTALGAEQTDQFRLHSHTVYTGASAGRDDGCGFGAFRGGGGNDNFAAGGGLCSSATAADSPISQEGGNETRPKNVTVNYFIRVN